MIGRLFNKPQKINTEQRQLSITELPSPAPSSLKGILKQEFTPTKSSQSTKQSLTMSQSTKKASLHSQLIDQQLPIIQHLLNDDIDQETHLKQMTMQLKNKQRQLLREKSLNSPKTLPITDPILISPKIQQAQKQISKVMDQSNNQYDKDMDDLKKYISQEILVDDQKKLDNILIRSQSEEQTQKKQNKESKYAPKDPTVRLNTLKTHVYSNVKLQLGEFKEIDWKVKDYIIRKNGLQKIQQKRVENEKQYKQNFGPEHKRFFKDNQIFTDIRENLKIRNNLIYNGIIQEIKKPMNKNEQIFDQKLTPTPTNRPIKNSLMNNVFQQKQEQKIKKTEIQNNKPETTSIKNNQCQFDNKKNNKFIDINEEFINPGVIPSDDQNLKLFQSISWGVEMEDIFQEIRNHAKKTLKLGQRGEGNQIACATFTYRNKDLRSLKKQLDFEQQKEQAPFYHLQSNNYNIRALQNNLNSTGKQDIHDAEFEVAQEILREHNIIKNYIKKLRSDYYLKISEQHRHDIDIQQIQKEFISKFFQKQKDHKELTKRIRMVLELSDEKKKHITYEDKNFHKNRHMGYTTKMDNIKTVIDDFVQKEHESDEIHHYKQQKDGIRGVAHRKIYKTDSQCTKRTKSLNYFSGGPSTQIKYTKYQRNRAAMVIQTAMRKYIGRIKFLQIKDQNRLIMKQQSEKNQSYK